MVKIKLGNQQYRLLMSMYALEQIEERFDGVDKMLKGLTSTNNKRPLKTIVTVITILINAGLVAQDRQELTDKFVASRLMPGVLENARDIIYAAIQEGKRSQSIDELNDEVRDVVLDELEKKTADR